MKKNIIACILGIMVIIGGLMSYNSIIETNSADPGGGTVGGSKNGVKIVRPGHRNRRRLIYKNLREALCFSFFLLNKKNKKLKIHNTKLLHFDMVIYNYNNNIYQYVILRIK